MARKLKFEFSGKDKTIQEINDVYENVLSSLDFKYSKVRNNDFSTTFLGYSEKEVHQERVELAEEVSNEFGMAMFASVESILRTDFIARCQLKKTDKLSRFYRSGYNPAKRIYTYGLSDIIMKGWKDYLPEYSIIIDRMNELFQYRNWLAHGRYWILPQNLQKVSYLTIYNDCSLFIEAISSKLCVK